MPDASKLYLLARKIYLIIQDRENLLTAAAAAARAYVSKLVHSGRRLMLGKF